MDDFRENRISTGFGAVTPQFEGQFAFGNSEEEAAGSKLSAAMLEGMEHFGHVIHGFDREDAVFAGVESRTSSPLRIPAKTTLTMESSTIAGIYPCGEGAGYAGGITSAAMDGMKTAEAIIAKYAIPKIKTSIIRGEMIDETGKELTVLIRYISKSRGSWIDRRREKRAGSASKRVH
ncbi:MAG: FAD-dependent protein [Clostridium fessum]